MDLTKIVTEIQYILAPAIMVSSAALFLLSYQTKFSNLASRFRAINQERRMLVHQKERSLHEEERLVNLDEQVGHLMRRATYVKNSIVLTYAAIICFVSASLMLFLGFYTRFRFFYLAVASFGLGLLLILIMCVLMIAEIRAAFLVISIEKQRK